MPFQMGDIMRQDSYYPEGWTNVFFGGESAQTADKRALVTAKQMQQQGFTPQEIWDRTGWNQFPSDKQWRFYRPDTGFFLDPSRIPKAMNPGDSTMLTRPLSNVIRHPEFAAAYPELFNKIEVAGEGRPNYAGSYNPIESVLTINKNMPRNDPQFNPQAATIHELQHAIQNYEPGQASGGSRAAVGGSHDDYWRIAGEAEARDAAFRYSNPNARKMLPQTTIGWDVPFDRQIVLPDDFNKRFYPGGGN